MSSWLRILVAGIAGIVGGLIALVSGIAAPILIMFAVILGILVFVFLVRLIYRRITKPEATVPIGQNRLYALSAVRATYLGTIREFISASRLGLSAIRKLPSELPIVQTQLGT